MIECGACPEGFSEIACERERGVPRAERLEPPEDLHLSGHPKFDIPFECGMDWREQT